MNIEPRPIPNHWTEEQALQVVDFLEDLIEHILWVVGDKTQEFDPPPPERDEPMFDMQEFDEPDFPQLDEQQPSQK